MATCKCTHIFIFFNKSKQKYFKKNTIKSHIIQKKGAETSRIKK
jgi:hypothetical protein